MPKEISIAGIIRDLVVSRNEILGYTGINGFSLFKQRTYPPMLIANQMGALEAI